MRPEGVRGSGGKEPPGSPWEAEPGRTWSCGFGGREQGLGRRLHRPLALPWLLIWHREWSQQWLRQTAPRKGVTMRAYVCGGVHVGTSVLVRVCGESEL